MIFYYGIPIILGLSIVTQGVLNQAIGLERGLGFAVLLNASVFFVLSIVLYVLLAQPSVKTTVDAVRWYYLIPGICGFLIVLGPPLAMSQIGSAAFFILLILAQISSSLLYDTFILGSPLSISKVFGAALTFVGAALFISAKK